jgi:uncharacterized protein YhbP (UPF0306 family)
MQSNADIEKAIRDYLPEVIHMSLSTSINNMPWTSEVHYAFDNDLNLYFISKSSTRHGFEIMANPNVSGTVVKQHELGQKPKGVYFEGTAEALSEINEQGIAYQTYNKRFKTDWPWIDKETKLPDGHRIYKIIISEYYVFDKEKYYLPWIQSQD